MCIYHIANLNSREDQRAPKGSPRAAGRRPHVQPRVQVHDHASYDVCGLHGGRRWLVRRGLGWPASLWDKRYAMKIPSVFNLILYYY